MSRLIKFIIVLLLTIYVISLTATLHNNSFLNDDIEMIYKGREVINNPLTILRPDIAGRNHILLYLLLGFFNRLFGLASVPYYIINLVFHFFICFMVYIFSRKLRISIEGSIIASFFFLVISTNFQVIGWVAEMGRIIMNFLCLVSLICFFEFRKNNKIELFVFSYFFWFCALNFSEEAVVFPFLLLYLDYFILRRKLFLKNISSLVKDYFLFLIGILLFIAFNSLFYRGGASIYFNSDLKLLHKVFGIVWSLMNTLVPRKELFGHIVNPSIIFRILLPAITFLPLLVIFVFSLNNYSKKITYSFSILVFSILWFISSFIPFIFRPLSQWREYPPPRYLYFSLVGLSFLVGSVFDFLINTSGFFKRKKNRLISFSLISIFLCYFFFLNLWTLCFLIDKMASGI